MKKALNFSNNRLIQMLVQGKSNDDRFKQVQNIETKALSYTDQAHSKRSSFVERIRK